jgi:ABC-2 type transport system permease protein
MVIFFGLPVFFAYSSVYHHSLLYYLSLFSVLIPFLLIPASLGTIITTLLINIFPARRTKDILLFLSVFLIVFLYLFLRFLQPERLVNPDAFATVIEYFDALKTPSSPFLPSVWATNSLLPFLKNFSGEVAFYQLLLWSTGAASVVMGEWVSFRFYTQGWSKSQEAGRIRVFRVSLFKKAINLITQPFSQQSRSLMTKDIMTFLRDSAQWSQLFLLFALVVVYLYNFSVLPLGKSPLPSFHLKGLISFINMGLAGFVLSAIAVRFIFPSISVEGPSFWIVKSSPLTISSLLWSKFTVGLFPLLILAEILIIFTNHLLRVSPFMMILSSLTIFFMTFGIVAMGVGIGAIYPRFHVENVAQIATGFGGLIYMLWAMIFIGVVVVLEAWPVYLIFMARLTGRTLSFHEWTGMATSFLAAGAVNIIAIVLPLKMGLKRLSSLEF